MKWAYGNESKIQKQPPEVFCKKGVFRNFAKFTATTFYNFTTLQIYNFFKNETLAQVLPCELCKNFEGRLFL